MKRLFFVVALATILFSCKDDESNLKPDDPGNGEEVLSTKKGACQTTSGLEWGSKLVATKPHWYYSWGSELVEVMQPENVEFVPMVWGRNDVDQKINELKSLVAAGKINYLLGFNEPDAEEQANMTVDEALQLWPKLQELNVPLGSPAIKGHPTNTEWLKEFMSRGESEVPNFRVDFICVHHYAGPNADNLYIKLKETYDEWNLPIWITEFAVADWDALGGQTTDNKYTVDQTKDFMLEVLPGLDTIEYVSKYAWFSFAPDSPEGHTSALYDEDGKLTSLGWLYHDHAPNTEIGAEKEAPIYDNIEGNLVPNGNFGNYKIYGDPDENADQSVGWFGYQFAVEPSDVVEGWAARMTNGWSGESGLKNIVPVEEGKTYEISYFVKWLGTVGSVKMNLRDQDAWEAWEDGGKEGTKPSILASSPVVKADEAGNNEWTEVTFDFTVPAGVSNLQIDIYKGKGTSLCLIDEVFAQEKQ